MVIAYMFRDKSVWIIPLIIQIVSYVRILGKMGKNPLWGIIPPLGDMKMSEDLFRHIRSFARPAIISAVLMITALYIKTSSEYGMMVKAASLAVYGVFLARMYPRLARQFGKNWLFSIGLVLLPFIFLPILGFGKSEYLGKIEFPPENPRFALARGVRQLIYVIVSLAEFAALVAGCFAITMVARPVRPLVYYMLGETYETTASVTDSDEIVSREDTIGSDYETAVSEQRSRDYYFADHSGDKKVVVMEYIIGSNLEDGTGSASINIAQMKDATAKGDGLDFVVEAGGSERWFTNGISDSTVGRYLISGGKLTLAEALNSETCMSEPENLKDFIVWTKENYPADRYMLVLWDHGGGFAYGYGSDDLNERSDGESYLSASEMIEAVRDSGVKFDVIGYDACLMQNIEYANAFEPYADYYLASQETEPAYGWYYTAGFGRLAEDPTISTEEFGRSMVSSYDQLYRTVNDGEPQPQNTLSLVDLTLVKPVYKKLTKIYDDSSSLIAGSPAIFSNMSAARSKAYEFYDGEQVDLVNYLTALKNADYKQEVASDEELDDLVKAARACVVYCNKDAAEGINGISTDFPYRDMSSYKYEYKQLKAAKYKSEEKFFNNFCSIIGSQKAKQAQEYKGFLKAILTVDYSNEEWYVKGFEDYDTTDLFVDIPLKETEDGYLPDLPEKTWDTIIDASTMAYMVTDGGYMYIGREHFDYEDSEGHPLIVMEDRWASIDGHIVCYEAEQPMETDDGEIIYKGTARAKLNGAEDVTVYIEWDPAKEGDDDLTGHVIGYTKDADDNTPSFMQKGLEELGTGDTLEFLFDIYDEEGKYVSTEGYGNKLTVVTQDMLTVKDDPFENGMEFEYYGLLTDVYQRELMTEGMRVKVED